MAQVGTGEGAPGEQIALDEPRGRWVLLAAVLGSGVALLDATVVNIALPAIGADLGADFAGLQWTVSGYALTLAALILLGGSLGDRYGRRRVFLVGSVWFGVAACCAGSRRASRRWSPRGCCRASAGRCSRRAASR